MSENSLNATYGMIYFIQPGDTPEYLEELRKRGFFPVQINVDEEFEKECEKTVITAASFDVTEKIADITTDPNNYVEGPLSQSELEKLRIPDNVEWNTFSTDAIVTDTTDTSTDPNNWADGPTKQITSIDSTKVDLSNASVTINTTDSDTNNFADGPTKQITSIDSTKVDLSNASVTINTTDSDTDDAANRNEIVVTLADTTVTDTTTADKNNLPTGDVIDEDEKAFLNQILEKARAGISKNENNLPTGYIVIDPMPDSVKEKIIVAIEAYKEYPKMDPLDDDLPSGYVFTTEYTEEFEEKLKKAIE